MYKVIKSWFKRWILKDAYEQGFFEGQRMIRERSHAWASWAYKEATKLKPLDDFDRGFKAALDDFIDWRAT